MGAVAPPIMPIFRSRLQGELLAAVLLADDGEFSLTGLADRLGAAISTVQREASRLEKGLMSAAGKCVRGATALAMTLQDAVVHQRLESTRDCRPIEAGRIPHLLVRDCTGAC